jgi:hypothetical protein
MAILWGHGAQSRHACPVIGKPSVTGIENAWDAGHFSCGIERPRPPDLPSAIDDGFGAAVNFAFDRGDAHFPEQILGRQGKKSLHARVLQSREAKAAPFERAAEAAGECGADAAIAVEEDPAAVGVLSFCISYF